MVVAAGSAGYSSKSGTFERLPAVGEGAASLAQAKRALSANECLEAGEQSNELFATGRTEGSGGLFVRRYPFAC